MFVDVFYSKIDDFVDEEEEVLFMAIASSSEDHKDAHEIDSESEIVDVDLEGELICALKEIKRLKMDVFTQKYQAMKEKENLINKINGLCTQPKESKRVEEMTKKELAFKIDQCQILEAKNVMLRKKLEKSKNNN